MTTPYIPGLREEGAEVDVTSFTPNYRYHTFQFGFQFFRWFIPIGRPKRVRCKWCKP